MFETLHISIFVEQESKLGQRKSTILSMEIGPIGNCQSVCSAIRVSIIWVKMAAKAMLSTQAVSVSAPRFQGITTTNKLTRPQSLALLPSKSRKGMGGLSVRCDYIGSPTNLIMVASTTLMLFAGRFGLAPSANRKASAGLKLQDRDSGLQTGDPAGFTGTDTLACGALGHIIGVGVVLGFKYIGVI